MTALRIGLTELRRIVRDRVALFFLFVFPVVLILLIGASFGGGTIPKVGLLTQDGDSLGQELVRALRADESIEIERRGDRDEMLGDVERGALEAALIIPHDYTSALTDGRDVAVTFVSKPGDFAAAVRGAVDAAVGEQAARVRAARLAEREAGVAFGDAYEIAVEASRTVTGTDVRVTTAGDGSADPAGRFDSGASTQLILFMFVNSLAGSAALVQTRQYGVLRRMLAAPVRPRTILLGQTLGRFFVAAMQGLFILLAAALLFGVRWGDPLGATAVIGLFALVSTGAAMLAGSVLKNEQQAGALVPFGLALAALGGSMVPLEVFPDTMRTISRVTPHAWANDAFDALLTRGAGVPDILPQLAALTGFAAVLLALGSFFLRRTLTA